MDRRVFALCIRDVLTFEWTRVSREPIRLIYRPDLWLMVNGEDDCGCRIRENWSGIALWALSCVFPGCLRCR